MAQIRPERWVEIEHIECPTCRRQTRKAALHQPEPRDAVPEDAIPEGYFAEPGPDLEDARPVQTPGVIGQLTRCRFCGHAKKDHPRFSSVPVRSTEERCRVCECRIVDGQPQTIGSQKR
jgi:hypothetical protein